MACVLTFNAPEDLAATLRALESQTRPVDSVLVVDNASEPPAVARGSTIVRSDVNKGPAGGHAEGLRQFIREDADFAWVMDDDIRPADDCLERLLQEADCQTVVRPTVIAPNGDAERYPGWYGVLIPRGVVLRVGYPREDLFWWIEDAEYLLHRIPRVGRFDSVVSDALATHSANRRKRTKPAWKYYYEARNTVWYRTRVYRGDQYIRRLFRIAFRPAARILIVEDSKVPKLAMHLRGLTEGARGRLGVTVRPQ